MCDDASAPRRFCLVGLALLAAGLAAAWLLPSSLPLEGNVPAHVAQAKRIKASEMILQFKGALDAYRLHRGSYPSEAEGLEKLTEPSRKRGDEPYIRRIPKDPFGEAFIYRVDGHSTIDIICKGEDLQEGTEDDITLRTIEESGE
jgi:type II secretion system protein G